MGSCKNISYDFLASPPEEIAPLVEKLGFCNPDQIIGITQKMITLLQACYALLTKNEPFPQATTIASYRTDLASPDLGALRSLSRVQILLVKDRCYQILPYIFGQLKSGCVTPEQLQKLQDLFQGLHKQCEAATAAPPVPQAPAPLQVLDGSKVAHRTTETEPMDDILRNVVGREVQTEEPATTMIDEKQEVAETIPPKQEEKEEQEEKEAAERLAQEQEEKEAAERLAQEQEEKERLERLAREKEEEEERLAREKIQAEKKARLGARTQDFLPFLNGIYAEVAATTSTAEELEGLVDAMARLDTTLRSAYEALGVPVDAEGGIGSITDKNEALGVIKTLFLGRLEQMQKDLFGCDATPDRYPKECGTIAQRIQEIRDIDKEQEGEAEGEGQAEKGLVGASLALVDRIYNMVVGYVQSMDSLQTVRILVNFRTQFGGNPSAQEIAEQNLQALLAGQDPGVAGTSGISFGTVLHNRLRYGPFYNVFQGDRPLKTMVHGDLMLLQESAEPVHLVYSAYGYSGSGKTHTLVQGDGSILQTVLGWLDNPQTHAQAAFVISDLYGEIRQEEEEQGKGGAGEGFCIRNLSEEERKDVPPVRTYYTAEGALSKTPVMQEYKGRDHLLSAYRAVNAQRRKDYATGEGAMTQYHIRTTPNNPESSRSHLLVDIYMKNAVRGEEGKDAPLHRITLLDLGGSEDVDTMQRDYFTEETIRTYEMPVDNIKEYFDKELERRVDKLFNNNELVTSFASNEVLDNIKKIRLQLQLKEGTLDNTRSRDKQWLALFVRLYLEGEVHEDLLQFVLFHNYLYMIRPLVQINRLIKDITGALEGLRTRVLFDLDALAQALYDKYSTAKRPTDKGTFEKHMKTLFTGVIAAIYNALQKQLFGPLNSSINEYLQNVFNPYASKTRVESLTMVDEIPTENLPMTRLFVAKQIAPNGLRGRSKPVDDRDNSYIEITLQDEKKEVGFTYKVPGLVQANPDFVLRDIDLAGTYISQVPIPPPKLVPTDSLKNAVAEILQDSSGSLSDTAVPDVVKYIEDAYSRFYQGLSPAKEDGAEPTDFQITMDTIQEQLPLFQKIIQRYHCPLRFQGNYINRSLQELRAYVLGLIHGGTKKGGSTSYQTGIVQALQNRLTRRQKLVLMTNIRLDMNLEDKGDGEDYRFKNYREALTKTIAYAQCTNPFAKKEEGYFHDCGTAPPEGNYDLSDEDRANLPDEPDLDGMIMVGGAMGEGAIASRSGLFGIVAVLALVGSLYATDALARKGRLPAGPLGAPLVISMLYLAMVLVLLVPTGVMPPAGFAIYAGCLILFSVGLYALWYVRRIRSAHNADGLDRVDYASVFLIAWFISLWAGIFVLS